MKKLILLVVSVIALSIIATFAGCNYGSTSSSADETQKTVEDVRPKPCPMPRHPK